MITKFNFKDRSIKSYAIRKLTPRECFRLMGVRDGVIDVMQGTAAQARARVGDGAFLPKVKDGAMAVAASQQYRQAGNSIVVDVLAAIYEQLWYPEERKPEAQLSFFDDLCPEQALPPRPVPGEGGRRGGEGNPHHLFGLRLAADGGRRAARASPPFPLDVRRVERHRQVRLPDARHRISAVPRQGSGRHHED